MQFLLVQGNSTCDHSFRMAGDAALPEGRRLLRYGTNSAEQASLGREVDQSRMAARSAQTEWKDFDSAAERRQNIVLRLRVTSLRSRSPAPRIWSTPATVRSSASADLDPARRLKRAPKALDARTSYWRRANITVVTWTNRPKAGAYLTGGLCKSPSHTDAAKDVGINADRRNKDNERSFLFA